MTERFLFALFILFTAATRFVDGAKNDPMWRSVALPVDAGEPLHSIVFANERAGWILAGKNKVLRTVDGGEHWEALKAEFASPVPSERDATVARLSFTEDRHGWAAGSLGRDGAVWETMDGGQRWTLNHRWAVSEPERESSHAYVTDVQFVDERRGWAVGGNSERAFIWATEDGGKSWKPQYSGGEISSGFLRVRFADAKDGWVWDSGGSVLRTGSGGELWQLQVFGLGTLFDIDPLAGADPASAWGTGGWGVLFHTSRNGMGFDKVSVPGEIRNTSLGWVKFVARDIGWLAGAHGRIFTTTDAGKNWRRVVIPAALLKGGVETGAMTATKDAVFVLAEPNCLLVRR